MNGDITKADVLDSIGEVVDAMTAFADRTDQEIELIERTDGTATRMGGEEPLEAGGMATSFDEIRSFDSIADLWEYLQMAEVAA